MIDTNKQWIKDAAGRNWPTLNEATRMIKKIEACEGMPAKLILLRDFWESANAAPLAPQAPQPDRLTHVSKTENMRLKLIPLTLKKANELITRLHRHHKPVRGHRFTIGCLDGENEVGAAVVGRPVGRETSQYDVAEVTRLVADGTPHVCSKLYSACARAAEAMGYERIQTFILDSEPGTSLSASGWYRIKTNGDKCTCEAGCSDCIAKGRDWNTPSRQGRRTDQPMVDKQRWGKKL